MNRSQRVHDRLLWFIFQIAVPSLFSSSLGADRLPICRTLERIGYTIEQRFLPMPGD
jgi:hypothetical protein